MKLARLIIENFIYPLWRDLHFLRDENIEQSHQSMITTTRFLASLKLTKFFLYDPSLAKKNFIISNAAGWNKEATIPSNFFRYLGFDRVVIGSVTSDSCLGNTTKLRALRIKEHSSTLNWLGLPNLGAKQVAKNLKKVNFSNSLPITISIAAHPQAKNKAASILEAMSILKDFGDRWEINISCPNLDSESNLQELKEIMKAVFSKEWQKKIFIKLSPDLEEKDLVLFLEICRNYPITGFVAGNSSKQHSYQPHPNYKGGLSGELLYPLSYRFIQKLWNIIQKKYSDKNWQIIACGGISNRNQILEYQKIFAIREFQIYTGFIYQGPKLIRNLIYE